MELKTKYQYSYFIYPYVIDEEKYDKYIYKLLKDKNCKLKIFEKEKNLNIYTYFLPNVRDYLFWSFKYSKTQLNKMEELQDELKSTIISKKPCTIFEYSLGEDVQGKVGEKDGIFFDISKIEIVCFNTGICFLMLKTTVEENKFSNILDFNYKFRDINSNFVSLKDYENIRLQSSSFKDIKDLSYIIKKITGPNKDAKEMNLDDERFLTYSYICTEQEHWNETNGFQNIKGEFSKFSNILPSKYQVNCDENVKEEDFENLKYAKIGITKQGTALLTSAINPGNYTRLPFKYEEEYLYTYLITLYKKIYINKINMQFRKQNQFRKTKQELLDFTQNIWIQEITNDTQGTKLYDKWKETLELDKIYEAVKNKYDIVYKDMHIEKTRKVYYLGVGILGAILILNIINFIFMYLFK